MQYPAKSVLLALGLLSLVAGCAHDARTAGSQIDDHLIAWRAAGSLRGDAELHEQAHIAVTSLNGIVLVTGETPTETLRDRAVEKVSAIPGIRRIHNEIRIAPPSSLAARSRDSLMAGEARTRIAAADGVEARIVVVADNASIYLLGLVHQSEGAAATQAATQVTGAERIVQLFEYLD
jgi:osmotically-inducible protein OsmY